MLDEKEIKHLADLARIDVKFLDTQKLAKDMREILEYVGRVKEVSGEGNNEHKISSHRNVFREDTKPHETGVYTDVLIGAAPESENGYVRVKKIL